MYEFILVVSSVRSELRGTSLAVSNLVTSRLGYVPTSICSFARSTLCQMCGAVKKLRVSQLMFAMTKSGCKQRDSEAIVGDAFADLTSNFGENLDMEEEDIGLPREEHLD